MDIKLIEKIQALQVAIDRVSVYDIKTYSLIELYYDIAKKMNNLVEHCNELGYVVSESLLQYNNDIQNLLNEGIEDRVVLYLNGMIADGRLADLINNEVLGNKANSEDVKLYKQMSDYSYINTPVSNYVFGLEYLQAFHMSVGQRVPTNVVFSGDSTTFGYGLTAPDVYAPNKIFKYACDELGFYCVNTINRGVSSACAEHWASSYVNSEMLEDPTMVVLRWGINEPSYDKNLNLLADDGQNYNIRRNVQDFELSMRKGLQILRNWKGVGDLTIVLMTPNSTASDLSFRNEKWHEEINQVIRRLARDFRCVFLDTYHYLQDVRGTGVCDVITDGAIHPLDMMNVWINELLVDALFKTTFVKQYSEFGKWDRLDMVNGWNSVVEAQYRFIDNKTIELRGLIMGGDQTPVSTIASIPKGRQTLLSIKNVSTEKGWGCLNCEHGEIKVGNLPSELGTGWVSLDGVRIYLI